MFSISKLDNMIDKALQWIKHILENGLYIYLKIIGLQRADITGLVTIGIIDTNDVF